MSRFWKIALIVVAVIVVAVVGFRLFCAGHDPRLGGGAAAVASGQAVSKRRL